MSFFHFFEMYYASEPLVFWLSIKKKEKKEEKREG